MLLSTTSTEEKNVWMAALLMLNYKSMLDRMLDCILNNEQKNHPLKLPPSNLYKFAIPDSVDNIVFEDKQSGGVPLIKVRNRLSFLDTGGTLKVLCIDL